MTRVPLSHRAIFWDALIAIALIVLCVLAWICYDDLPIVIGYPLTDLFLLGISVIFYGSFIAPKRIKMNTKSIQMNGLDLRIAIVSDMHVGPYKGRPFLKRAVKKIIIAKPDIIFLVGDFIFDHTSAIDGASPLLSLYAPLGVFAVLGNHDSGKHQIRGKRYETIDRSGEVISFLEKQSSITFLRNKAVRLIKDQKDFYVAGIDDVWMKESDLQKTLRDVPAGSPLILLSHNPDAILNPLSRRASLIISGHTHGGQVRLPFFGALHPMPDELGKKFDQGIFHLENGSILAISHGIGETQARARLFCPPEIMILTIRE